MSARTRILVIRLGALGDIVLCLQAFHEIRAAHPGAEIALLTRAPFAAFARKMPWFDRVMIDPHPPAWRPDLWIELAGAVRAFAPNRIYDLQGKRRQSVLYALLGGLFGPEWSGAAPFCSHPRLEPQPSMHFTDFLRAQLQRADVAAQPPANLVWLDAPLAGFSLPERYAVLIPASAPGGEYKRWPAGHYAALAKRLGERGITSLVAGARQDGNTTAKVVSLATPHAIDFAGHTDLFELAAVMRRALCVIGNDTGPMHMAAALGAPTLALLSGHTDPAWSAPKPPRGAWRQAEPLSALDPAQVLLALDGLLDTNAESMETPDRNRA